MKFKTLCVIGAIVSSINIVYANYNIFLNAPPKTGNHLIAKAIRLLTGKRPLHSEIAPTGKHWTHIDPAIINRTGTEFYLCSHAFALPENINTVEKSHCKMIFMIRDPRDQLVSLAIYMKVQASWPHIRQLSLDQIIMMLIYDYSSLYIQDQRAGWSHPIILTLQGIDDFYNRYLDWMKYPFVYTTSFEKLVGPQGGGSRVAQMNEIRKISQFIGISVTEQIISYVADNIFGQSDTFRKGQIGSWKMYFNNEHIKAFKEKAGILLIELGYEKDLSW